MRWQRKRFAPPYRQRWFAWYPVATTFHWVWLEWVERSAAIDVSGRVKHWYYTDTPKENE